MNNGSIHPADVIHARDLSFPIIAGCEHIAGRETFIVNAFKLQRSLDAAFDVTCDCEDGAPAGMEQAHAEMIARLLNSFVHERHQAGVRIHDRSHRAWHLDVDVLVGEAGNAISYFTLPKAHGVADVGHMIDYVRMKAAQYGVQREITFHVLIETHGALHEAFQIAAMPGVQVLDFGLMDFVSDHHGAIPAAAMNSPTQFEHPLLVRAKTEVVAAALANNCVPAHNVTTDFRNAERTYSDAARARNEFGFLRMWSVHPEQILPIVNAMKPAGDEVEAAGQVLLDAQAAGWGPIRYAGRLQDRGSYRYYWEVLLKARANGIALPSDVEDRFFAESSDNPVQSLSPPRREL